MRKVLVSDIFGLTDELIELSNLIDSNSIILDPYAGEKNLFSDEKIAYEYFSQNCGLEYYSKIVEDQISKIDEKVSLIGFSVGASAIWKISNKLTPKTVRSAHLFYGSQIRNNLDIRPEIHLNVVLPRHEDHFSVSKLKSELSQFENVAIKSSTCLHGFMNKLSCNYNQAESGKYVSELRQFAT